LRILSEFFFIPKVRHGFWGFILIVDNWSARHYWMLWVSGGGRNRMTCLEELNPARRPGKGRMSGEVKFKNLKESRIKTIWFPVPIKLTLLWNFRILSSLTRNVQSLSWRNFSTNFDMISNFKIFSFQCLGWSVIYVLANQHHCCPGPQVFSCEQLTAIQLLCGICGSPLQPHFRHHAHWRPLVHAGSQCPHYHHQQGKVPNSVL